MLCPQDFRAIMDLFGQLDVELQIGTSDTLLFQLKITPPWHKQ